MVCGSQVLSRSEVCVLDYGLGNLRSIQNALAALGVSFHFAQCAEQIAGAQRLILPGVGAFHAGMTFLEQTGLAAAIHAAVADGASVLGICLGMQLLLDEGEEGGLRKGLGLIPGRVQRFKAMPDIHIPHMGFNEVRIVTPSPLFFGIPDCSDFYFIHSFHASEVSPDHVLATTCHGDSFASVIGNGKVIGTQFHPEKSQGQGLTLLKNFCET